jgi:hypothetical protein
MKPTAHSIGVSKVIEPRHIVAIQLKTFTAGGHGDQHGRVHEEQLPVTGMPVVNMWCAQTMNDRIAIDAVA